MDSADTRGRASTTAPTWLELTIVASLTLVALLLRAWGLSRVGLGQYDEGVYALSALGVVDPAQPHRLWQSQVRFSPPVYFLLVALSYLVGGGPSDTMAVVVNVVLGTLLVPVAWWAGRRWFGARAGIVAAALTAFSQYQILMSRTALTDISFTLFFTIALVSLVTAMEEGGTRKAILAGIATGVAWNTKYHGWFVLVIGVGAWIGWTWFGKAPKDARRRAARALIISGIVAVCCYVPWAVFIQAAAGGTGAWSTYFARMLGLDWIGHFLRHARLQGVLEGPWTRASLPLAALAVMLSSVRTPGRPPAMEIATAAVLGLVGLVLGGAAGSVMLAAAAVPVLLKTDRGRLPTWIALAWTGLWVVAAPVYRPYFRLLLPFAVVTSLLAGVALDRWMTPSAGRSAGRVRGLIGTGVVAVIVFLLSFQRPMATDPWRDGTAMRRAADAMTRHIPPGADVRVIWEPPVAFYLQLAGRNAFEDIADITVLDTMQVPRYIVTGIYVRRTPALQAGMARHASELELLGQYPVQPTDLRILDDFSPAEARNYWMRPDSTFDLALYLFRPRGAVR